MLSLAGNNPAFKEQGYWDRSGWNRKSELIFMTTARSWLL